MKNWPTKEDGNKKSVEGRGGSVDMSERERKKKKEEKENNKKEKGSNLL